MSILVFNAGSTSLKFGLFDDEARQVVASGDIDWAHGDRRRATLAFHAVGLGESRSQVDVQEEGAAAGLTIRVLAETVDGSRAAIKAVGHRVVHGGAKYPGSVVIDEQVKETVSRLAELAPLHNPPALAAICAAERALPGALQIAVFDTAFYAALPPRAHVYPLPYEWYSDWGVRRFGFHGISHQYCASRAAEMLHRDLAQLRLVSCHLGGGCSAIAVREGRAVATTMGFTPLDGLMMGTRCGSIDPGVVLHLQRSCGLPVEKIDHALNHGSGLLGVSGVSPDFAEVERAANQGSERARLACDIFADQVRSAVGGLVVTMGGVNSLVFTDRVGEGSPTLRAAVCEGLECLGISLDRKRNAACRADSDVALAASPARILVIHTREELMIAREASRVARKQK